MGKIGSGKTIKFLVYLVAVVLANLAGITLFFRLDLTADKVYSISDASRRVVATLSEPLTINVFFTRNLPAPHNNTERYLRDLLEEYAIYANKYFNYRVYDVSPEEGDLRPEIKENQELARNYGINPIQIQVIEEDEVKFQKAYMGLVILHGDLLERIPTITSVDGLEYQLTTAIMKLNNKVSALLRLPDKIRVKLYLSSSLNQVAPYIGLNDLPQTPERVKAIVDKLNPRLFGKLDFVHLDPSADPQALQELKEKQYSVLGLKWPEIKRDNIPAGEGQAGLVLEHGQKSVALQLINVLRLPIIGTRYELADPQQLETVIGNTVESLLEINQDIGYLADKGTLPLSLPPRMTPNEPQPREALNNFRSLLAQQYTVREIRLSDGPIPAGLNCLIVARPTEPFTDYELYQIDQHLMKGNNLVIFPDAFNEVFLPPQAMGMNQGPRYIPINSGLEKLLEHYGVRVQRSYVMDERCFKQEMPQQLGGGERPIYFAPLIQGDRINANLDFMKNIKRLVAVRISPLELVPERIKAADIAAAQVFASSDRSWEMRGQINLNPNFISPPPAADQKQSYPLAYLLEGKFASYFDGKPLPEKPAEESAADPAAGSAAEKSGASEAGAAKDSGVQIPAGIQAEGQFMARGKPGKIFVLAASEMLTDNVIDDQGRSANAVFTLNAVDALNGREDIAVMRSKRQQFNPLGPSGSGTKAFVKAFNIAGLPVLVVAFGGIVWFRRIGRKRRIQAMFQK